jgi:hypothetical protein
MPRADNHKQPPHQGSAISGEITGEPGTHAPRFPRFAQRIVHVLGHYAALV